MKFRPFKGIHASEEFAKSFASHNVNDYSQSKLEEVLRINQDAFLNIIEPTISNQNDNKTNFKKVRENLIGFLEEDILSKGKAGFYIYKQTHNESISFKGVIGALHLEASDKGEVLELEKTLPSRVDLFTDYLKQTNFQADPVVFTYSEKKRMIMS